VVGTVVGTANRVMGGMVVDRKGETVDRMVGKEQDT
jgi:hypothetical protein